jgi:hypothetical protein
MSAATIALLTVWIVLLFVMLSTAVILGIDTSDTQVNGVVTFVPLLLAGSIVIYGTIPRHRRRAPPLRRGECDLCHRHAPLYKYTNRNREFVVCEDCLYS